MSYFIIFVLGIAYTFAGFFILAWIDDKEDGIFENWFGDSIVLTLIAVVFWSVIAPGTYAWCAISRWNAARTGS